MPAGTTALQPPVTSSTGATASTLPSPSSITTLRLPGSTPGSSPFWRPSAPTPPVPVPLSLKTTPDRVTVGIWVITGPPGLLPGSGSATPSGGSTWALLTNAPATGAVPVTVIVTLAPAGKVGMVILTSPLPEFSSPGARSPSKVGQTAPPVAFPQVQVTALSTDGTWSVTLAPSAESSMAKSSLPMLLTTNL